MSKKEIAMGIALTAAGIAFYEFVVKPVIGWAMTMFRPAAKAA